MYVYVCIWLFRFSRAFLSNVAIGICDISRRKRAIDVANTDYKYRLSRTTQCQKKMATVLKRRAKLEKAIPTIGRSLGPWLEVGGKRIQVGLRLRLRLRARLRLRLRLGARLRLRLRCIVHNSFIHTASTLRHILKQQQGFMSGGPTRWYGNELGPEPALGWPALGTPPLLALSPPVLGVLVLPVRRVRVRVVLPGLGLSAGTCA